MVSAICLHSHKSQLRKLTDWRTEYCISIFDKFIPYLANNLFLTSNIRSIYWRTSLKLCTLGIVTILMFVLYGHNENKRCKNQKFSVVAKANNDTNLCGRTT
jgi:hypothetical protein